MRIVLIILGFLVGAALGGGAGELLGAILGGFAGYTLAELMALRRRAESLEREVRRLRGPADARDARAVERPPLRPAAEVFEAEPAVESSGHGALSAARESRPEAPQPLRPETPGVWQSGRADASPNTASEATASSSAAERARTPSAASAARAEPESPIVRAVREYFTGGNTLVRVGVVILFIGVAFLLRYIAEHTNVPIQLRLAAVAAGGVALLALGWRLRRKRPGYALALQGGGIGILYLTVFASLRLFGVMSPAPAFILLAVLSGLSAALAVLQSSLAFAILAVGCGFLAPVLASSGQGNHVVLFSYYGVLNLAIVAIAGFKAWRPLNVVGFLFTFVIGTAWGVLRYRPELFASTEPFLILFFLLYVVIAVLFSVRQEPTLRGYVDGTLVFGVPIVAFSLQAALVRHVPFALACSAAAASLMYLALAWALYRQRRETQRLLVEAFMALGVVFLTLTVPLALEGRWSAATWALEGAGLVWIGCRQNRRLPRAFGGLLQVASGVLFLSDTQWSASNLPVLNSTFLGTVMIAAGSVFAAHALRRAEESLHDGERFYAPALFMWGLAWWLVGGLAEIFVHAPDRYGMTGTLLFLAFTALVSSELRQRFDLPCSLAAALLLLPVMVVYGVHGAAMSAVSPVESLHPFADGGWISWPAAFAAFYFICRRHDPPSGRPMAAWLHVPAAWLLVFVLTWELAWQVDRAVAGSGSWPAIAWAIVPGVALFVLPKLRARLAWPIGAHEETYLGIAGSGIAVALMVWGLATNLSLRGDPYPLPYVPLLNPLDLAQVFVLLVLARYWLAVRGAGYGALRWLTWKTAATGLAALTFVWLNAVLLRTLHHWAGVPFDLEGMLRSTLVQTSLSIFWTVLALATMLLATRFASRIAWLTGASLLGVVIAKLFFVDLSSVSSVERIVSFVGVGLLTLVVGYFSPLPPAREERA
jgi:uncharacterized membrane protein